MSFGFDWQQEDEKRRQRQAADDHYLELQALKKIRLRIAILAVLGTLALAGLVILIRQKIYDDQFRDELRQTAINEARAIWSNDNNSFLLGQLNEGNWPVLQAAAFKDYQKKRDRLGPQGEIVRLESDSEQGRVVLREMLDGKPYLVTWFYRRIDTKWKHGPPLAAYWGGREHLGGEHVNVDAFSLDRVEAQAIQAQMEDWWAVACRLTACGSKGPPRITVRLVFDLNLKPRWSPDDETALEIPSPHLGRVAEDGSLEPDFKQMLARQFAGYWAGWQAPAREDSTAEVAWLHTELATWLAHELGAEETAPLMGPLSEADGPEAVMALAGRIQSGSSVLPALRAVTGSDPLGQPFDWSEYLAARLRAEAALVASGKVRAAAEQYGDPERPRAPSALTPVAPGSLRVVGVEGAGDITWVQTEFTWQDGGADAPLMAGYEPFRLAGDEWLHTTALPADFGQTRLLRGKVVRLHVAELDAPTVSGLLDDLETQFGRAAADLGIPPQEIGNLEVTISPAGGSDDPWGSETPLDFGGGLPGTIQVTIPSPHLANRLASQSASEAARGQILRDMVIQMIRYRAYTINPRSPLVIAIARWELQRLAVDADAFLPVTAPLSGVDTLTLDRMWARCQAGPFVLEDAIGARVLIDLLVDRHGPEAVGALVANLSSAEDVDDWLESSLDVTVDDIQAQWVSATRVAIAQAR